MNLEMAYFNSSKLNVTVELTVQRENCIKVRLIRGDNVTVRLYELLNHCMLVFDFHNTKTTAIQ